jgi:DNA-binding LacI/PurR family transcriptional regulator
LRKKSCNISFVPVRRFSAESHVPKYQQVIEILARDIHKGKYKPGEKFPSEAALVQQFRTSRITIGRALRELTARGLVQRIAGSGTYVRARSGRRSGQLFGILLPERGTTEIFDPIAHGIASSPLLGETGLLWGQGSDQRHPKEHNVLELCRQFIARGVAGVFFAPLEGTDPAGKVNREVVARLERARIPLVLLDRCVMPYPHRCAHDLVGIDNRRAGFLAADRLVFLGAKRIVFVGPSHQVSTVEARLAGVREATIHHNLFVDRPAVIDSAAVLKSYRSRKPDGYVCANDRVAGALMQALLAGGVSIPDQVRIVGIDDVEYASLLPVPLTTVHQPCREIGRAAVAAMRERTTNPQMLARDILLDCRLVIRRSCGAN